MKALDVEDGIVSEQQGGLFQAVIRTAGYTACGAAVAFIAACVVVL